MIEKYDNFFTYFVSIGHNVDMIPSAPAERKELGKPEKSLI